MALNMEAGNRILVILTDPSLILTSGVCTQKTDSTAPRDGKLVRKLTGGYQDGKPWSAEITHLAKWLPVTTWKASDEPDLIALNIRVASGSLMPPIGG